MKQLSRSELIVNNDGSVYHLGLIPEQLCDTIITVGDPDRVALVCQHMEVIHYEVHNREFRTIGGSVNGHNIMVMSTGIGTDNIDIVFNELAFLANYDLKTLKPLDSQRELRIVRLGTSGSISKDHTMDEIVWSKYAISLDDLFFYYNHDFDQLTFDDREFPVIACSPKMESLFSRWRSSLTITAKGFYGPQFRNSQIAPKYKLEELNTLRYKGIVPGNMEMETAGIYGMSKLLGFEAISINALLADRNKGTFSSNAEKTIQKMITESLQILCP